MISILDYFDLNKRMSITQASKTEIIDPVATTKKPEQEYNEDPLVNDMEKYWANYASDQSQDGGDTRSLELSPNDILRSLKSPIPWWLQIILYLGTIIGAMLSSSVIESLGGANDLFGVSLPFVILSSALAIIVSPPAFEKLCRTVPESFLSHFFLFILHGVFWYIFITAFSLSLS